MPAVPWPLPLLTGLWALYSRMSWHFLDAIWCIPPPVRPIFMVKGRLIRYVTM